MNINDLAGKTIEKTEELFGGEVLKIIFTDGTILRIRSFGFGDGFTYDINPID